MPVNVLLSFILSSTLAFIFQLFSYHFLTFRLIIYLISMHICNFILKFEFHIISHSLPRISQKVILCSFKTAITPTEQRVLFVQCIFCLINIGQTNSFDMFRHDIEPSGKHFLRVYMTTSSVYLYQSIQALRMQTCLQF